MILVSLFLVTTLIFALSYKHVVPLFSTDVEVTEASIPQLLGLGAVMTLISWVGLVLLSLLLAIMVIPLSTLVINSTSAGDPSAATITTTATICLLIATQGANWLAAMIYPWIRPNILRVADSRSAFKAAWAPTIFTMPLYWLITIAPLALVLRDHLNVH
ncbi:MAG: hypothetical protein JST01_02735 [Cyanobacteria bacterium SZAS TMP-1]|nr:hypothetical protein [Cyanobacteria bacterium SZAS TMP-1]